MGKSLTELMQENFETHKAKGWVDGRSVPEDIALIHSELSEALEDHRAGKHPNEVWYEVKHEQTNADQTTVTIVARDQRMYPQMESLDGGERIDDMSRPCKPCGIPSEMADVIIRILNFSAVHGIDIEKAVEEKMAFNATRPHRHGGKAL